MINENLSTLKRYLLILLGSFLFCLGLNAFIVPVHLYNGGTVGIAQIIRTLLTTHANLPIPANFDISGIINLILNIPLLILAFVSIGKKFFIRTVFSVITQTIFFSVILIPETPIIPDTLTACLIGGIAAGCGVGITLKAGGAGGGLDILGVYFAKKKPDFSVGKLSIYFNAFVYLACAILFELPTAIYSILYSTIYSTVVDKIHYQNINMNVIIFSKEKNLPEKIISELRRGVTHWDGVGGYTDTETHVVVTVCSKYEINQLRRVVLDADPQAFIIFNEGLQVTGNYEKRL